jgi:hypothetical protein
MNPELQRLLELVSQVSQGLGEERIVEYISDEPITKDGKLYEVIKPSINQDGAIKDFRIYIRRLFSCGHVASKDSYGGICSCESHDFKKLPVLNKDLPSSTPMLMCKKCLRRCIRCQKIFSVFCVTTVASLPGVVFCKRCARSRRWGDFFLGRR